MMKQEIKALHTLLGERRQLLRLKESLIFQIVETDLKLDSIEREYAFAAIVACAEAEDDGSEDGGSI